MAKLKVYEYSGCGTCRKALKYLKGRETDYSAVPIREQPPTKPELQRMLRRYDGNIRRLFNTSGRDYRDLKLSESLPTMSTADAIELLSQNGNLVKRPFVPTASGGVVGFKEEEWEDLLDA